MMKQQKYFKLSKILFGLILCLGGKNAMALSCTANVSSLTINVGNIVVQSDVVAGQSITNDIVGSSGVIYSCTTDGSEGSVPLLKTMLTGYGNSSNRRRIFNTNLPGIGIAIGVNPNSCGIGFMRGDYFPMCKASSNAGGTNGWALNPIVQLFKTGPSGSGSLSGSIGYFAMADGEQNNWHARVPISISGNVTTLACSINTPNIQVPLGNIMADSFTSVGSVYNARQFNVGLNCDAGARINVTLTGTQNTDTSTAGVLQLTNAGSSNVATGVGVQILYNGSPMTLGNKITLKTSAGGAETFPFTAQYYQTAPTPTAGAANATATLEIVYQ